MQGKIAERLALLKEPTIRTPLYVFLHIYYKAQHECYIDYMHGAKLLYQWLSTPEVPIDYQEALYLQISNSNYFLSCIADKYTVNKLAEILARGTSGAAFTKAHRAILITLSKKNIPAFLAEAERKDSTQLALL